MKKPHVVKRPYRKLPWVVCCIHCGLMDLKNEATRQEMKKPCPGREDD